MNLFSFSLKKITVHSYNKAQKQGLKKKSSHHSSVQKGFFFFFLMTRGTVLKFTVYN